MDRKYSIITVTYNNAEGLRRTLESIKALKYRNWELIIIDGASSDDTLYVIDSEKDIVTYASSERDKGVYDAMNKGLRRVTGDYVIFMNAGDCFADVDTLDKVNRQDGDIILGSALYGGVRREAKEEMSLYDILSIGINHQSTYYRREIIQPAGFDYNYPVIADLKSVVAPLVQRRIKISFITDLLSVCEGGGMSKQRWMEMLTERQRLIAEVVDPFYARDYARMSRLNYQILPELTVLSQFSTLYTFIRLLSRMALWYNRHFKHIPL